MKRFVKNSGSVLIFILMAVALLGLLTFVLTRNNASTTDTGDDEKSSIKASQIMIYAASLQKTVDNLKIRGCSESEINFAEATLTGYTNTNAPANKSCDIFSVDGGGAALNYFPNGTIPPTVTGGYSVLNVGTSLTDLVYLYRTSKSICMAINKSLGILNNGTEGPPSDMLDNGVKFVGSYSSAGGTATEQIDNIAFSKKKSGCRNQSGTGSSAIFEFYQVLLAR